MNNPDLRELTQYAQAHDPKLISQVKNLLSRSDIGATKGVQRLCLVCENFRQLTYDQAYRMIGPDMFQDEFEEMQSHKAFIKFLNYLRILLSLAPLILTWFALFSATSNYQNDLAKHPDDQTITFLRLWQDGFHHTTAFTFSTTAIIDVVLLLSFLFCTILILAMEYRARQSASTFATELREVTNGLLKAVIEEGISQTTKQADIDKIVKAVRVALGGVFTTTEDVIRQAMDVVIKANDRVDQLFTNQVQPMFSKFDQNVSTFHLDVNKLTQEASVLATASTNMATASSSMTTSASQMANSASGLQASVQQIDAHLVNLNNTENTMVTRIEAAQQKVATEVGNAASSMNVAAAKVKDSSEKMENAAKDVKKVGDTLATINPTNVKKISDEATNFAILISQVNKDLQDTANLFGQVTPQRKPTIIERLTQSLRGNKP